MPPVATATPSTTPTRRPPTTNLAGSSMDAAPAIAVDSLTHQYPAVPRKRRRRAEPIEPRRERALDDVSFDVTAGEIFGILGPNGGGKTTLFRILSTLLRPTLGTVRIFGHDCVTEPDTVRRFLGVVFQTPSLDLQLTAEENLLHQGHLYGLRGAELRGRIDQVLVDVGLAERGDERVGVYSGGMRRRVELAKAVLHQPRLLLLDEPATGLDPGARHDVWQRLKKLRDEQGVTIVLTTHLMDEAERCDRLAVLHQGRLAAVDTPHNLMARIGGDVIAVEPTDPANVERLRARIDERFGPWTDKAPVVVDHTVFIEKSDGPTFVATLAAALAGEARSITVGRPTLEDAFLHLTGHRLRDAP